MTIEKLFRALKDAVENGYGDRQVYARKFGTSDTDVKELEFFNLILRDYGGPDRSVYGEIVFKEEEE